MVVPALKSWARTVASFGTPFHWLRFAWLLAPDRSVEQFDHVIRRDVVAEVAEFFGELQKTPGIAGDEGFSFRFSNAAGLALADLVRGARLGQVVDTGRTTATCVGQFEKL